MSLYIQPGRAPTVASPRTDTDRAQQQKEAVGQPAVLRLLLNRPTLYKWGHSILVNAVQAEGTALMAGHSHKAAVHASCNAQPPHPVSSVALSTHGREANAQSPAAAVQAPDTAMTEQDSREEAAGPEAQAAASAAMHAFGNRGTGHAGPRSLENMLEAMMEQGYMDNASDAVRACPVT